METGPRIGIQKGPPAWAAWNERLFAYYNDQGTAEQHIKEGKHALKWTRLSCMRFAANAVRLQLHALAYNLANFLRCHVRTILAWSTACAGNTLPLTSAYGECRLRLMPLLPARSASCRWRAEDGLQWPVRHHM
jgi:hypothetical protein